MNKKFKYLITLSAISVILISCEDPISSPQEIPLEKLLSSKDTVEVDGKKIFLATYLQRDFMPVSPPGDKPLNAVVFIQTVDSTDLPA